MENMFDVPVDRRNTGNMKGEIAAGIGGPVPAVMLSGAEMDYPTAPVIRRALSAFAEKGIYGFTLSNQEYCNAVCGWMKDVRKMNVGKEALVPTMGTVFGISTAVRAFTQPKDGVIIQHPSYYRFDRAVLRNGRRIVSNPLKCRDGVYSLDFEDLEEKMSRPENRLMILCNPHNPTGRVFRESELKEIARLARRNDVIVLSDEIFAETAQPGYEVVPYCNLDERGITATSFGKCFNFTGVNQANFFIPDQKLRERYIHQQEIDHFGSIDPFFYQAVLAGYSEEGYEWICQMNAHTAEMYRILREGIQKQAPELILSPLEGSFVGWIDCRALGKALGKSEEELKEAFLSEGILADPGEEYGPGGEGHIRLNLATTRKQMEIFVIRLGELTHPT